MSGFARIVGVSVGSISHWRMGDNRPTLPVYLRLARVFGASLVSLLTGKISPAQIDSLDLAGVPHWRNLWARQRFGLQQAQNRTANGSGVEQSPPRSLKSFQNRNRYHYATLHKHFPWKAIQRRFQEYSAAMVRERRAKKIAEFRKIAYQLHERGIELLGNRLLNRVSVPRSLDHRIACELMAEIKHEILANQKPLSKSSDTMAKQRPSPDALRAQTE